MKQILTINYTGNLSKFQELEAQNALHAKDYVTLLEVVRTMPSNSQYTATQMAARIGVKASEFKPILKRLQEFGLITLDVETKQ